MRFFKVKFTMHVSDHAQGYSTSPRKWDAATERNNFVDQLGAARSLSDHARTRSTCGVREREKRL